MDTNKLKEKYHEKFRKNIKHDIPYFEQLLKRAWNEYENHSAMNPNNRPNGSTPTDRMELKAIMELIKLYQSRVELKQVEYTSC